MGNCSLIVPFELQKLQIGVLLAFVSVEFIACLLRKKVHLVGRSWSAQAISPVHEHLRIGVAGGVLMGNGDPLRTDQGSSTPLAALTGALQEVAWTKILEVRTDCGWLDTLGAVRDLIASGPPPIRCKSRNTMRTTASACVQVSASG